MFLKLTIFPCSRVDNVKKEEEIKALEITNQKLFDKLKETENTRKTIEEDFECKTQLCLDKQLKITDLDDKNQSLNDSSRKLDREIDKCQQNHEMVKLNLRAKIELVEKIKTMKKKVTNAKMVKTANCSLNKQKEVMLKKNFQLKNEIKQLEKTRLV